MRSALTASDLALIIAWVFGAVLALDVAIVVLAPPAVWAERLLVAFIGLLALAGVAGGLLMHRRQAGHATR